MEHLDPQKLEVLSVTSNGFPFVRMPPLENLHLRVLKLDSYLFIHQTQLATMLAHTITLEELEMLTCSMTLYVAVREGSENLSELNTWAEHAIGFVPQLEDIQPHQKAPILRGWINRSQRWHHLFHDLPTLLPKLKRFVWDTTQPYDVTANHFRIPWSSGCMCTAPKDLNIPPDTPVFAGLEADDERDTFPEFCRKEDDAAFEKLKDILSLRKSGGAHSSTDASDEEPI